MRYAARIADFAKQELKFSLVKLLKFQIFYMKWRLREITFREVGEGTNEPIDLDKHDHYHHLFLWDNEAKKLWCLPHGLGSEIYPKYGINGFTSTTCFV
jgi:hypothetical protein